MNPNTEQLRVQGESLLLARNKATICAAHMSYGPDFLVVQKLPQHRDTWSGVTRRDYEQGLACTARDVENPHCIRQARGEGDLRQHSQTGFQCLDRVGSA